MLSGIFPSCMHYTSHHLYKHIYVKVHINVLRSNTYLQTNLMSILALQNLLLGKVHRTAAFKMATRLQLAHTQTTVCIYTCNCF